MRKRQKSKETSQGRQRPYLNVLFCLLESVKMHQKTRAHSWKEEKKMFFFHFGLDQKRRQRAPFSRDLNEFWNSDPRCVEHIIQHSDTKLKPKGGLLCSSPFWKTSNIQSFIEISTEIWQFLAFRSSSWRLHLLVCLKRRQTEATLVWPHPTPFGDAVCLLSRFYTFSNCCSCSHLQMPWLAAAGW